MAVCVPLSAGSSTGLQPMETTDGASAAPSSGLNWAQRVEQLRNLRTGYDLVAAVGFWKELNGEDLIEEYAKLAEEADEMRLALCVCSEIAGEDGEAVEAYRMYAAAQPRVGTWAIGNVQALRDGFDELMQPQIEEALDDAGF